MLRAKQKFNYKLIHLRITKVSHILCSNNMYVYIQTCTNVYICYVIYIYINSISTEKMENTCLKYVQYKPAEARCGWIAHILKTFAYNLS